MIRRYSRKNPSQSKLTPQQKAERYAAKTLEARAMILQYGVASVLNDGLLEPQEHDACRKALDEAYELSVEADGIHATIRAATDAAEEAEDAKVEGQQVQ